MRDAMPGCAALVDDLRAAFGAAEVDQWIRDGLRDVGGFGGSARLAPLHGPLA